ncbi:MAG TPA: c-type cytochrome [Acidimicrobiales bacterium]|nr:c-type cytochrome [Acidimicrobiales bacterium]
MTEVPEHLLKRSRDRRAALGLGGGGDGGGGAGSESAPGASESESTEVEVAGATAAARPAAVEPLEPATPPKPVPSYVRAALNRKKIPVWVMPVLAFLPIWAVIYVNTLSKPYSNVPTQIAEGAIVFSDCSGCHGSQGEGGVGRQLNNGEVLKTFPYIADQLEFVWIGDQGIGNGNPYGNKNRPGGPHIAGSYNGAQMPAWNGTLTQADLLAVVRHERETLSGEVVPPDQIASDGSLLWPNGQPVLDPTTGILLDPAGQPLLNPITGKLNDPKLVESAKGKA